MCGSVRWRVGRWLVAEDPASRRRAEKRAGVCIDTRSMGVVLIACVQRCPPWARRFVRWGDPRAATESTATPLPKPMPSSCHSSWRSSGRVGRRRQRFGSPRRHDDGRILSAAYSRPSSLAALPISTRTRLPPARPSRVTPAQHTRPYSLCAKVRRHFKHRRLDTRGTRKRGRRQREAALLQAFRRSTRVALSPVCPSSPTADASMRRYADTRTCMPRPPHPIGPSFPHTSFVANKKLTWPASTQTLVSAISFSQRVATSPERALLAASAFCMVASAASTVLPTSAG